MALLHVKFAITYHHPDKKGDTTCWMPHIRIGFDGSGDSLCPDHSLTYVDIRGYTERANTEMCESPEDRKKERCKSSPRKVVRIAKRSKGWCEKWGRRHSINVSLTVNINYAFNISISADGNEYIIMCN